MLLMATDAEVSVPETAVSFLSPRNVTRRKPNGNFAQLRYLYSLS